MRNNIYSVCQDNMCSILSYLDIEDIIKFIKCLNKQIYIYYKDCINTKTLHMMTCSRIIERRNQKKKFFEQSISYISPISLIYSYNTAKLFIMLDDIFHSKKSYQIVFSKKCQNNEITDRQYEWTKEHKKFFRDCVEEIQLYYDNLLSRISKFKDLI